jgi:hypothetical protein
MLSTDSTDLTKALGPLDVEIDQRDWFSEFREERAFAEEQSRRQPQTLFMVVSHGRPAPIVLPGAPPVAEVPQPQPGEHRRRSMLGRVKRAVSPTLTALFIAYVAIVFMTALIGIRRNDTTSSAEPAVQVSTPDPAGIPGPANDRP